MPAVKRFSEEDEGATVSKLPKLEQSQPAQIHPSLVPYNTPTHNPAAYSPAVQQQHHHHQQSPDQQPTTAQVHQQTPSQQGSKKRGAGSSSRTGQACDRCKTRKIRCDDTLGGCMPCRQNNTECTTTDRITNRAQVRGHTEAIEQEASILRQQVADLQAQLRENNIEPRVSAFPLQQAWPQATSANNPAPSGNSATDGSPTNGLANAPETLKNEAPTPEANVFAQTPQGGHSHASKFVGVSGSHVDSIISPVTGLSLSVFGMEIDLATFVSDETEAKLSSTSWDSLFKSISKGYTDFPDQPPPLARLPSSYEECSQYTRVYLELINAFVPILDKPSFTELVGRFYTPDFRPDVAERVQLHTVLAMVKFHFANRNPDGLHPDKELEAQYRAHLEFALQHTPQLTSRRSLADIQALALICVQLRNHPTPHAAYFMTHWVSGIILDMGLHRSASAKTINVTGMSAKQIEMRKRIFWSIMGVLVLVGVKLGRPLELRSDDIDIELPEPIEDLLPHETAQTPEKRCSFAPGIEAFRLINMIQDVYNGLYIVKPTGEYETTLRSIEARLSKWRERLPAVWRLSRPESQDPENRMFALWLAGWDAEIQLLLHHPAVCRSVNPQIIASNMQQSVEASFKIIEIVSELKDRKSNDTSWLSASTYIAAIFTLLFAYWHRRDQLTQQDISKLQTDLDACYGALEDVGIPLGTGKLLPDRVSRIVNPVLTQIEGYIGGKQNGSEAQTPVDQKPKPDTNVRKQQQSHNMQPPSTPRNQQETYPPNSYDQHTPTQQAPTPNNFAQSQQHTPQAHAYQHTFPQQQPQQAQYAPQTPQQPGGFPQQPQYGPTDSTLQQQYQPTPISRAYQPPTQPMYANPNPYNSYSWNDLASIGGPSQWMNFTQTLKGQNTTSTPWQTHAAQPVQPVQPPAQTTQAPQNQPQPQAQIQANGQPSQQDYIGATNALMAMQNAGAAGTNPGTGFVNMTTAPQSVSAQPWPMSAGFNLGGQ